MKIDKVFIINLKERTDRKSFMLEQMNRWKISNFEFFEAIKPTIEELNNWNSEYCSHEVNIMGGIKGKFDRYRIGSLGCLKSHYEVIKLSLERGYKNVLILEDDTQFVRNFNEIHNEISEVENYDMFYLAGSHLGTKQSVTNNVMKIVGTYTTGSYLITEKAMEFFVNNIEGYEKEVDVFFGKELQPRFDCYASINRITKQKSGFSDIQQREVEYELN